MRSPFQNSILSARLICVLDFISPKLVLSECPAWIADCWNQSDLSWRFFFSINNCSSISERSSSRAKKNLTSLAFDNVYSVPVQAA